MSLTISKLDHSETIPMDLMLLADPSEEMVNKYLNSGDSYLAKIGNELIGAFILTAITEKEVELKNIAVYTQHQGQKHGTEMLRYAIRIAKMEAYESIVVKTADVAERQIAFYEKHKFKRDSKIIGHFFKYYKEPIIENGKEAIDQIVLKRIL
jgi:ribosomal protein S18 acetylase RimI-like enzyme